MITDEQQGRPDAKHPDDQRDPQSHGPVAREPPRSFVPAPLRATDPGVTNPEIKKNNPIANSPAGTTGIASIALLTVPRLTSRTSWYGHDPNSDGA